MKILFKAALLWGLLISSAELYAASFPCGKAQTQTEVKICENLLLNDADVKMANTYNIVRRLVPMGTRSIIQSEQVKWLQLRDQCQDNLDCLKHVYQMRQQKLDMHLERVYRGGPY